MNYPEDMDISQLKIPPHSLEAEQSVIGGLLIAGSNFDAVADELSDSDFYRPEHRLIYRECAKLAEDSLPHDIVTVLDALSRAGSLDRAGGHAYIASIARGTPSASNIRAYALAVRKAARARALIAMGQQIAELGWDQETPIEEREELAQASLMQLGDLAGADNITTNQAIKAVVEDIDRRYNAGQEITGLMTGFADIDKRTRGLQPGNLILVAGRPSMGKTALVMNWVEHVVFTDRKPVLIFSMEMTRNEIIERMIASIGKTPLSHVLNGQFKDDEWVKLSGAVSLMKDSPLVIDDRPALSIAQMRSRARKLHKKNDLAMIVVDYLQLASVQIGRRDGNREQEVSSISRGLKALAKELNTPVVAIAQLNRSCESRGDKRPMNSDLRDSGQIEQDADLICMVYRDDYYNEDSDRKGITELIWTKFRNGEKGTDFLSTRLDLARFESLDYASRPQSQAYSAQPKRGGFEYK